MDLQTIQAILGVWKIIITILNPYAIRVLERTQMILVIMVELHANHGEWLRSVDAKRGTETCKGESPLLVEMATIWMEKIEAAITRDGAEFLSIEKGIVSFVCKCGTHDQKDKVPLVETSGAFCDDCRDRNTIIKRIKTKIENMKTYVGFTGKVE
jgi:hypothetical protein